MFIGDSRQTADSIILSKLDQTHKRAYRLIGCSRYLMVFACICTVLSSQDIEYQ